jgi:hypothetical protein
MGIWLKIVGEFAKAQGAMHRVKALDILDTRISKRCAKTAIELERG